MWTLTDKFDPRLVALADRHYSRQTPGSNQFCRPGYNLTLHYGDDRGAAAFVWWRPVDEVGRKDGLRAVECTLFRNESAALSSDLIRDAVACLLTWERYRAEDLIITGVNPDATGGRRSRRHRPGHCFLMAGWEPIEKQSTRANVWLWLPRPTSTPREPDHEPRGQIPLI